MSKVLGKRNAKTMVEDEGPTRAPSDDEVEDDVVGKKKTLSKERLRKMMEGRRNKGSLSKRLQLCIPPRLMQRRLKTDKIVAAVPLGSAIYAAGAVERLIDDIMASARDIAATERKQVVSSRHIMAALKGDEELGRMFKNVTIAQGGIGHPKSSRPAVLPPLMTTKKSTTKRVAETTANSAMDDEDDDEEKSDGMGDGEEEEEVGADDSQEY